MKKFFTFISGRLFLTCLLIFLQISAYIFILYYLSGYSSYVYGFMTLLSILFSLKIAVDETNTDFKVIWIFFLLAIPFFSWAFYLIIRRRKAPVKSKKLYNDVNNRIFCEKDISLLQEIENVDIKKQFGYILSVSSHSLYNETESEFFPTGEEFFKSLENNLKKAEKFIFLEYFIINKGKIWSRIFDILKEKAQNGVEVRILYDDLGTIALLPKSFEKELKQYGIKCAKFNVFSPSPDILINYRDHRKIAVIDGIYSYTGGINLADEYATETKKYGKWKDYGIMLKGKAVKEMTVMFLRLWGYSTSKAEENLSEYLNVTPVKTDGLFIPFGDGPVNAENITKNAYINMILSAKKYAYIITPYLIPDSETEAMIKLAAKSGVDVRIITPNIPDKWYVDAVTKSNYNSLIKAGVRIYEYKPGFIHAKSIISDDKAAILGTANFDFRSFYFLFENSVLIYNSSVINKIKSDIIKCIEDSIEITEEMILKRNFIKKIYYSFMKFFAPFM